MTKRRMVNMQIVDSDAFLEMPVSTQLFYFHLLVRADDEGFVGNPRKIMKITSCSEDDIKILIAKRFILAFDGGVVVIKHWLIHNTIRMDRFNPTVYQDERNSLYVKENKAYTDDKSSGCQTVAKRLPQVKLSKVKLSKKNDLWNYNSFKEYAISRKREDINFKLEWDKMVNWVKNNKMPKNIKNFWINWLTKAKSDPDAVRIIKEKYTRKDGLLDKEFYNNFNI